MSDRQQFAFYKSYDDIVQDMTDEEAAKFIRALLDVQFMRKDVDEINFDDRYLKLAWTSIKHSLKKSIEGYKAKSKNSQSHENGDSDTFEGTSEGVETSQKTTSKVRPNKEKEKEKEKEKGKGRGRGNTARVREDHPPQDFEKPPANSSPTLQQVIYIGTTKLGMSKESCEKFYWHFQAKGWRGIVDWTAKLMQWSIEDKARRDRDGPGKVPETYSECRAALKTWAQAGKNKGWEAVFENRTVKIADNGTPYDAKTVDDLDFETNGRFLRWLMRNWNLIDPSVPAVTKDGTKVLEMIGGAYASVESS